MNNGKYDGHVSARKDKSGRAYNYVRLAQGKWVLCHRYIYEQAYGPIPPKHCIMFVNGDTTDCNIDNLRCISMKENVERNKNYAKARETMKKTWRKDKIRYIYGLQPNTKWFKRKKSA